jgi:Ca2+-binding EF-hand superfamily protein
MSSLSHNLKLAGFLLNITEWDRHLEVVRQILNGIDSFEPYEAFLRIHRASKNGFGGGGTGITSREIENFMRENSLPVDLNSLEVVVKIYDTKFNGYLDFEDFLKMTLTRDNPSVRFDAAANRQIKDIREDELLAEEVEYCLARLFSKAVDFVRRMKIDAESQSILGERDLFNKLLSASGSTGQNLDFKVLKRFFEQLKIVPKDSEIIAILRIIDINDDGVIDKTEFDYFLALFNLQGPDVSLMYKLKDRNKRDNEFNYFGERKPGVNSTTLQNGGLASQTKDRFGSTTRSFQSPNQGWNSRQNPSSDKNHTYRVPASDIRPGLSNSNALKRTQGYSSTSKDYQTSSQRVGLIGLPEKDPKIVPLAQHPGKSYHFEKTVYSESKNVDQPITLSRTNYSRLDRSSSKPLQGAIDQRDYTQASRYTREVEELRMLGRAQNSAVKDGDNSRPNRVFEERYDRSTSKRVVSPPRTGINSQTRTIASPGRDNTATPSKRLRTEYSRLTPNHKQGPVGDSRYTTERVSPTASSVIHYYGRERDLNSRGGDSVPKLSPTMNSSSVEHKFDMIDDLSRVAQIGTQKSSSPSFRAYENQNGHLQSVESMRTTSLYKEIKLN